MHSLSRAVLAAAAAAALLLAGCGGSEPIETTKSAGARPAPAAAASGACREGFVNGHERENKGEPSGTAFLPSIEQCSTLAEWTAAAKSLGVDLRGREPNFVEMVCAQAEPAIQSLVICQEATAELQLRASDS